MTELEEVQALVLAAKLVHRQVILAARKAMAAGCDRSALAYSLGVSRSTLYRELRQYLPDDGKEDDR